MSARGRSWHGIVLIGPRAAGKTTLGRALAARLGWGFADADQRLAEAVGEPAGAWFARVGEKRFRAEEERVTLALLQEPGPARRRVLALGGGAVLSSRVRRRLAAPELAVVLVMATPEALADRIAASAVARPALTELPLRAEVEAVLRARRPLYEELARVTVDTTAVGIEACCAELIGRLDLQRGQR